MLGSPEEIRKRVDQVLAEIRENQLNPKPRVYREINCFVTLLIMVIGAGIGFAFVGWFGIWLGFGLSCGVVSSWDNFNNT